MTDATNKPDQIEEEIVSCEISDELLEAAAAAGNAVSYTLGFCTGLAACPA